MFKILADEAIPFIDYYFGTVAQITKVHASKIDQQSCAHFDGLLVRSVTKVDASLLAQSNVKWVGTATIGVEHLDNEWLQASAIEWHSAPGCNALAVVQYVMSALAAWSIKTCKPLTELCIGIVGLGQVGKRLQRALSICSIDSQYCDPFVDEGKGSVPLPQLFQNCDVISLHVPLTKCGLAPTLNFIDRSLLDGFATDKLLINAARGKVIEATALEHWISRGGQAVLDVWPEEPNISEFLFKNVLLGTPHIAGYSVEGKHNATRQLYDAFCQFLGIKRNIEQESPLPAAEKIVFDSADIRELLMASYNIARDDQLLRSENPHRDPFFFTKARNQYNLRRDYAGQYSDQAAWSSLLKLLSRL